MSNLKKYILVLFSCVFAISISAHTVFKTPSGAKYHLSSCRMVKNVSEEITISKAKTLGLQPCKTCKPQNIYQQGVVIHKAQGQNKTVQCRGLTKAGTRCKHMTSIANGFCYQHQPK